MKIIGIDPGTAITGIGIVEHSGDKVYSVHYDSINLNSKFSLPERLKKIYDECLTVIERFRPDEFAIETAFYGKNVQSTLKLGQARGVAIIAALNSNLKITEYSPREIKKSVTGNGASSKVQVQYMVRSILSIREKVMAVDCSDALAVALCHYYCVNNKLTSNNSVSKSSSWKFFVDQNPGRVIKSYS